MQLSRIISFIIVLVSTPLVPFLGAAVLFFVYVALGGGVELLVVSVAVDAHFGTRAGEPHYVYTLTAGTLLILSTFVKPFLVLYKK